MPLRNTGAAISPQNVFLILQGLETLSLRMERHTENALKVAEYLQKHPKVKWVNYAGLKDHPQHALAQKYVKGKPSAILTFGVQHGLEGAHVLLMPCNCSPVWSISVMPKVWPVILPPPPIVS